MHRDIVDLRDFYERTRLGGHARNALGLALRRLWPDVRGQVLAGFGYATPVMLPFLGEAARVIALMPADQGVTRWPREGGNLAALTYCDRLPLATGGIDRLIVLHGYEAAVRPHETLRELHRILAPGGRAVFVVPNRTGLWARTDAVPFGRGHPFTAGQLRRLLRRHGFDPCAEAAALYAPPTRRRFWLRRVRFLETLGSRFGAGGLAGVLVMEATKLVYVPPNPTAAAPVRRLAGALEGIAAPRPKPVAGRIADARAGIPRRAAVGGWSSADGAGV